MTDRTPPVPLDAIPRHEHVQCNGGPLSVQVFHAGDLADRQRAAARTRSPHTPTTALAVLHYRPTEQRVRVWDPKNKCVYDARICAYRPLEVVR